jgi:2-methylcitrate dehydratase PrpD
MTVDALSRSSNRRLLLPCGVAEEPLPEDAVRMTGSCLLDAAGAAAREAPTRPQIWSLRCSSGLAGDEHGAAAAAAQPR